MSRFARASWIETISRFRKSATTTVEVRKSLVDRNYVKMDGTTVEINVEVRKSLVDRNT